MLNSELSKLFKVAKSEEQLENLLEELETKSITEKSQGKEFYTERLENANFKLKELRAKLGQASTPEQQANVNAQIKKQENLIKEYQKKRIDSQQKTDTFQEEAEQKFTVKFISQGGKESSMEVEAPSEEEARKKSLDMADIEDDNILSITQGEKLEPEIIPTKEPEEYDEKTEKKEGDVDMENKKDALKGITESLATIFELLKTDLNEEVTDKGDAAAEPVATEEKEPELGKPEMDNKDILPADEHKEVEEVKEVVVESEISDTAEKAAEEVENAGDPEKLNDVKSDTLDKNGELVTQPEEVDPEKVKAAIQETVKQKEEVVKAEDIKDPAVDSSKVFPADEHKEAEEVEEVIVESSLTFADGKIKLTIPFGLNEKFAENLSDKANDVVTEALRTIYGVFSGAKLNEEESIEIPDDVEAEVEVKDDKIEIEIPLASAEKKDLSDDEKERIEEAVEVLDAVLKEEIEISGEIKGTEIEAKADNNDLFPADEHKETEEVKEVVVEEVTEKGDIVAEPVATEEKKPEELQPSVENKDILPADEHKEVEEVKEVVIEEVAQLSYKDKFEALLKEFGVSKISDLSDESKREFFNKLDDIHVSAEEKAEKEHPLDEEKLNDAGSDTLDKKGELEHEEVAETKEAKPEDVIEVEKEEPKLSEAKEYKSVKEAFLLESGYFSKDSYSVVTADQKKTKLENQMALLVARDSKDPLYEELVRTTALAKKLQTQLQERYNEIGKEKANQLVSLKNEVDVKSEVKKEELFNPEKEKIDVEPAEVE